MITITRTVTQKVDEKKIFEDVKDYLLDDEIEFSDFNYTTVSHLPKDAQCLIFATIGTMMIDYARSEEI